MSGSRSGAGPAGGVGSAGVVGLAGAVASGVFGLVLTVVISRGLGTAGAGALFAVLGLLTIAAAGCCLGADTGLVWTLPRRQPGAGGDAARVLPVALGPPLLAAVLMAAAGALAAPGLAGALLADRGTTGTTLVRVAAAGLPLVVLAALLVAAVRGLRPVTGYVAVQSGLLAVGRPVLIGGVVLAGGSLVFALVGWLAPVAVAVVVCAALLAGPTGLRAGAPVRPRPDDWRRFWSFALPRAGSAAIDASGAWTGVLLVAALAGPAEAGVFGAVGRCVLAGQLAMHGLRVAVAPRLSRLFHDGDLDAAAALHRQTSSWVIALSWPGYLLLAAFAPGVLGIFGADFAAGSTALAVLAVAMLVNVGLGNVQTILLMSGHSGQHLVATLAGLVVSLAGGVVLIPPLGLTGAALAWGSGIVLENVLAAAAARRALGRPLIAGRQPAVAAGVAGVVSAAALAGAWVAGRGLTGLAVAVGLLVVPVLLVGVPLGLRLVRAARRPDRITAVAEVAP